MTSPFADSSGSPNTNSEHPVQPATGPFMLTLCRLAAPVAIRPPQAPHLKAFTFFTSNVRQEDGTEQLCLHMGYFRTLSDADRWVQIARRRYPEAAVALAPVAFSPSPHPERTGSVALDSRSGDDQGRDRTPVPAASLSDTQVLRILDARYAVPRDAGDTRAYEQIALMRPEDTSTRHSLKEAVTNGAPVFFVVQLQWSAQPIDLSRVPTLDIFKTHTLYATESRREGRRHFFLRLGFFEDPISAKQVAVGVRTKFPSAAVVPVAEQEVVRARDARTDTSSIPYLAEPRMGGAPDSHRTSVSQSKPLKVPQPVETLEQTLEKLAERESWTNPDSLSETGVRHLKVEVQEHTPSVRR